MRLVSLISAGAIDLSNVRMVVLDEADKLFEIDSGHADRAEDEEGEIDASNDAELSEIKNAFLNQVDTILASCTYQGSGKKKSDRLQRALFSATITPFVTEIASGFLEDPVTVSIGTENAAATTINQKLLFVGTEEGKLLAIRQLIQKGISPPVLIFLQNKERAKELFRELVYDGINVDIIHADRTQAQREAVIAQFRAGDIWFLICTDLMARGIDFKGVNMVINYDLPTTAVAYIHRIGRTGRAGKRGEAVTLFTEADMPNIRSIANVMKLSGCHVPDWMLQIKQVRVPPQNAIRDRFTTSLNFTRIFSNMHTAFYQRKAQPSEARARAPQHKHGQ
jgi:ATP-dependent RNA helicase DDX52/ROK1